MKTLKAIVLLFSIFCSPYIWADGDSSGDEALAIRSDLPVHLFEGEDGDGGDDSAGEDRPETRDLSQSEERRAAELVSATPDETDGDQDPPPPAIRNERVIAPTVAGDGTTQLDATEISEEEAARLAAEEAAVADRERAQAEARAAAERIRQQRLAEEAEGITCQRDKSNLVSHQRRIFELESSRGNKLIDLLKREDDLKARVSTFQTLMEIWKEYQGFLTSNAALVNGSLQSPASAQEALSKLDELQNFIATNQQPVERYQVAAEVLSALPDRQAIRGLATDEQKFEAIIQGMESRCQELGTHAQSLQICNINLREDVRLEPQINRNPTNRAELINKFVNTAVNIDGADYVFNLNFSSLFVDDERHTNLTGQAEFATTMQSIIQKSKDYCRHQVLLEDSEDVSCLKAPLNEVLGGDLSSAQENVINRLRLLRGGGTPINNISDLTNSYLRMARATNNFHEEMTGGTINTLGAMARNIDNLQAQFDSAEAALTNPATVRALRTQFKNLTKEKIINLGHGLNNSEFQRNQEIYKQYITSSPDILNAPGALDFQKGSEESKAQFANKIVEEILCGQNSGACPVAGGIFSQDGDNLVLNQENIIEIFNNMMDSAGGPEALSNILGEGQEQGLKDELNRVKAEIAAIKNGNDYKSLNAFKDFIWEQAKESCMQGNEGPITVHTGESCAITQDVSTGLNNFLQIGDDLLSFQNRQDARASVEELREACIRIHGQDSGVYQRDYVDTGICPAVFEERERIVRDNIRRAERVRRGPSTHDPNIIYEYDSSGNVVDRHVPSSNLAIFLPQAAYTVNEQLPFYFVQRPGMNMAIENWRQMGFQQKTAQAYWDAQRQSWLNNTTCGAFGCYYNSTMLEGASPTFGNFGFSFGSTTTVPTTFNAGASTLPPGGTGFGF